MMDSPVFVILSTIALIILSAFFVIIEFALLAARKHRLEEQAVTKRSARAALRGMNELTIMLAVAQFGITICTFALGAITKPAVDAWLGPILTSWGAPEWLADSGSFLLSLLFVTFLHLVVGEMAPKSWAIAHPELAANIIGIPSRVLAWLLRPLLKWVNNIANRLVAASGVTPVDSRASGGLDAAAMQKLVEHSADVGTLEDGYGTQLKHIFELEQLRVSDLLSAGTKKPTSVGPQATVKDIHRATAASGHLRILVERPGSLPGLIHVRDVLDEPDERPIADLARDPAVLDADTRVYVALTELREAGEQFAVVVRNEEILGVVTLSDVVRRVLPHGETLKL